MNQRITPDKREVSFKELWWYIISKWRALIVGIIVGALAMGAFSCYKNYNEALNSPANMNEDAIVSTLTDAEIEEVNSAVDVYNEYKEATRINSNSYIMKLNPSTVYRYEIQVYVDTDYSASLDDFSLDYTEDAIELLKACAKGYNVKTSVEALSIEGLEVADVEHMILVTNMGSVLNVAVYGKSEDAKQIGEIVKKELTDYTAQLNDVVGTYTITILNENLSQTGSELIRTVQTARRADAKALSESVTGRTAAMSLAQTRLYNLYISDGAAVSDVSVASAVKAMDKMYVVCGAIAGALVVAAIAIVVYMFGAKLRSINEIEQVYNVEIVGKVITDTHRMGLDKISAGKRNRYNGPDSMEKQIEYVSNTVINKCRLENISNVSLCGSAKINSQIVEGIAKNLEKAQITCAYVEALSEDVKAVNSVVAGKNVIIMEQIDVTDRKNLIDEIEVCDRLDINMVGMIVLL